MGDELTFRDFLHGAPLRTSYVHGACAEPLSGLTIPEMLETAARGRPDKTVYRFPEYDQTITNKELLERSDRTARSLIATGVKPGDTVMVVGVDDVDFYIIVHAVFSAGAVLFNPFLFQPKEETIFCLLTTMKPTLFLYGHREKETSESAIKKYRESSEVSPTGLVYHPGPANLDGLLETKNLGTEYSVFLKKGDNVLPETLQDRKQDVTHDMHAWLISTTGSTGAPKLVYHSHQTLVNFAKFSVIRKNPNKQAQREGWANPTTDDVLTISQSLSHLYHWQLDTVGVALPSNLPMEEGFVEGVMKVIQNERITTLSTIPLMLVSITSHPERHRYDLSSFKGGILVTRAIKQRTCEKILELFPECSTGYGLSEFFLATTSSPIVTSREQLCKTAGYCVPHVELKIVGETGAAVPIGEVGEIYLRGWPLYSALHPTTKSEMRVDSRHWFHTGDIGKMDESGHVTIIGRKSDSIRYKKLGDVVYPAVIESVATRYHNTREAVVLGFEDDLRGISIVACVILEHDTKEARKETEEYLSFELRELDRPDRVIFLQDFPRVGARQKVARTKLQEQIRSLLAKESK